MMYAFKGAAFILEKSLELVDLVSGEVDHFLPDWWIYFAGLVDLFNRSLHIQPCPRHIYLRSIAYRGGKARRKVCSFYFQSPLFIFYGTLILMRRINARTRVLQNNFVYTILIVMDKSLKQKSREFAVKVVLLHKQLSARRKESVMSEELLRSGAGIGAELAKAECALSKNDQLAKVYKALQDCAETKYWLELLNDTDYLTEFEFNDTLKNCDELGKLLVAKIKTLRTAGS